MTKIYSIRTSPELMHQVTAYSKRAKISRNKAIELAIAQMLENQKSQVA